MEPRTLNRNLGNCEIRSYFPSVLHGFCQASDDSDKARTHICPGYTGQHMYWVTCNKAAQQTVKDGDLSVFSQDKGEKNPTQLLFL